MKNLLFVLLTLIGLTFIACNDDDAAPDTPACVQDIIDSGELDSTSCVGLVTRYNFRGENVFVLSSTSCFDGTDVVLDAQCDTICMLGGFVGALACDGEANFYDVATDAEVIYEEE